MLSTLLLSLAFATLALARTDLVGCTSSTAGPSLIWYVPGTGELCDFLDCGGGRAPPKTTVPGCPLYKGTATYSPSYLPGYGPDGKGAASSTSMVTTTGTAAADTAITTFDLSASNSGVTVLTGTASSSHSASVTSMPNATPAISSSTFAPVSSSSGASGSSSASSSSTSTSSRNAAPTAWIANAGLMAGLGAVVAVL